MNQPPNLMGYQQPNYQPGSPYGYYPQTVAPAANRAGILSIVIGLLVCLFEGCNIVGLMVGGNEITKIVPDADPGLLIKIFYVIAGVLFILGIGYIVMGAAVRRGSKGSMVTLMVFSVLLLLYFMCNTVGTVNRGTGGGALVILSLVMMVVALGLLIWHLISCGSAIKEVGQQQLFAAYYQRQMWQQQQMYGQPQPALGQQPGYGQQAFYGQNYYGSPAGQNPAWPSHAMGPVNPTAPINPPTFNPQNPMNPPTPPRAEPGESEDPPEGKSS